ncbi:TPA: LuxR C-terminal-related transcriptional regulator [Yersinia enterocolitica]
MKRNNQSSVMRFRGGAGFHTRIRNTVFPHSISILSQDGYLTRGLFEVIKETLDNVKAVCQFETPRRHYSDRRILFIDIAHVENLTRLNAEMTRIDYTDLFVMISHKDYSFHQALFPDENENNITYIFLDDALSLFRGKIMSELVKVLINKTRKTQLSKITLSEHTLINQLSKQEAVFIQYFKKGLSNCKISKILNKSEKTISGQKHSAMKKIGARTDSELFQEDK